MGIGNALPSGGSVACCTAELSVPSFASNNEVAYDYAAGGCTDSTGGLPCSRTDPNLSFVGTGFFNMPTPAAGTFSFVPVATGPRDVYLTSTNAGMNIPISIIWTGDTYVQGYAFMTVTVATIDGQNRLPGALDGKTCGTSSISLQMLCTGDSEYINPPTNNYSTLLYSSSGSNHSYDGDYTCYNHYVGEPGVELRVVPGSGATTNTPTVYPLRLLCLITRVT